MYPMSTFTLHFLLTPLSPVLYYFYKSMLTHNLLAFTGDSRCVTHRQSTIHLSTHACHTRARSHSVEDIVSYREAVKITYTCFYII
jgi:DNA-binding transcriptional regulator YiaG